MYWEITKDLLAAELDCASRAGYSRGKVPPETATPQRFRLLDDDGEVYYEGILIDPLDRASGFEPLDWAQYDSGCTEIQYWEPGKGGGWRTL